MKIFLAGDSTVCDYSFDSEYKVKRAGWGRYLQSFFVESAAAVFNYALSGRSSKSYCAEPEYRRIWNEIAAGDFLFVQFGHNDEKINDPARGTAASGPKETEGSFKWYLYEKYIIPARREGALVVLVTPVNRRGEDGRANDSHKHYADAVRELAAETDVPLIDLTLETEKLYSLLYEREGESGTAALFPVLNNGAIDNTHFNGRGARKICSLFVREIKRLHLSPAIFLRNNPVWVDSPWSFLVALNAP